MIRLAPILTALAVMHMLGGHWAVLQVAAWTKMFSSYTQTYSITESIVQTLDPDSACSMCLTIREGRSQEESSPAALSAAFKLDVFLIATKDLLNLPAPERWLYPKIAAELPRSWVTDNPDPVPRFLA